MIFLDNIGEWPIALIGLGVTFLVALVGATFLGWWVMRADARNRADEDTGAAESQPTLHEEQAH